MTNDSPFANLNGTKGNPAIPIIGQPTMVGAVVVLTMACTCPTHPPIVGVVGAVLTCATCKASWQAGCEAKFQIVQVVAKPAIVP